MSAGVVLTTQKTLLVINNSYMETFNLIEWLRVVNIVVHITIVAKG